MYPFLSGKLGKFWKSMTCVAAPMVASPDPAHAGSSLEA